MPKRRVRAEHAIDWPGAGLLAAGTASLLLGLVWAGRDYAWSSGHVLGGARDRSDLAGRLRALGAALPRADPAVRALTQPDRRGQRRLHGARRDGDVRDDLVRAAVRAGRDRLVGDVVRRRAHAAAARRRDDVVPLRPARLANRPLPLERRLRPAGARARDGAPLADGRPHDEQAGRARDGGRRGSGSAR